ncbi:collagen alpha-2(I) chain [Mobula hypostoma]|uniref:collagen alpha-2(I) chain n=1 Tax=Mobula hypostoma TaxID=723540 RepID=UPI002FC281B3
MAALVADYGSSESDGGSESEPEGVGGPRPPGAQARQQGSPLRSRSATGEPREEEEEEVEGEAAKLPPPQLEGVLPQVAGVFANPFAEERREQLRLLEKHVRLTGRLGEQGPGGPRICLPYRKDGRCRYGVNCKFAHDSDLPGPQGPDPGGQHSPQASAYIAPGNRQAPAYIASDNQQAPAYIAPGNSQPGTKRRPGLSPGLLPPKRSLKDYQAQRAKEGLGYL